MSLVPPIDPALLDELPPFQDCELSPPLQGRAGLSPIDDGPSPLPVQDTQNTSSGTLDAEHASAVHTHGQAFPGFIDPKQLGLRSTVRTRQNTPPHMPDARLASPGYAWAGALGPVDSIDPALPQMPSSPNDTAYLVGVEHATPGNAGSAYEAPRANSGMSDEEFASILRMHIGAVPNMPSPAMRPGQFPPAAGSLSVPANISAPAHINSIKHLNIRWDERVRRWEVRFRPPGAKQECGTFAVAQHGSKEAAERAAREAMRKFVDERVSLRQSSSDATMQAQSVRLQLSTAAEAFSAPADRSEYLKSYWNEGSQRWVVSFSPPGAEKAEWATFSVARHGSKEAAEQEARDAMQKIIDGGGSLRETRRDATKRALNARREVGPAPRSRFTNVRWIGGDRYQLHIKGSGSAKPRYPTFSVSRYGSQAKALEAAERAALEAGMRPGRDS